MLFEVDAWRLGHVRKDMMLLLQLAEKQLPVLKHEKARALLQKALSSTR